MVEVEDDDAAVEEEVAAAEVDKLEIAHAGLAAMVLATEVRLKYASMLLILRTLSDMGGPLAHELPLDQLFQSQKPGVEGTLLVMV